MLGVGPEHRGNLVADQPRAERSRPLRIHITRSTFLTIRISVAAILTRLFQKTSEEPGGFSIFNGGTVALLVNGLSPHWRFGRERRSIAADRQLAWTMTSPLDFPSVCLSITSVSSNATSASKGFRPSRSHGGSHFATLAKAAEHRSTRARRCAQDTAANSSVE